MFRSRDIQVSVFLTIPWFTKSVTSWWVLVQETGFLNISSEPELIKSPNLTNWYKQTRTIIFRNILNNLKDWGYVPGPFQFSHLLQLLNNQLCQDSTVSFFWKVNKWNLMVNAKMANGQVSLYSHFNEIMKGPGTSF